MYLEQKRTTRSITPHGNRNPLSLFFSLYHPLLIYCANYDFSFHTLTSEMFLPFILILYVWQGFKYDSRDYALMNMLHRFQYDFIGMGIETKVDIGNARSIEIWKQDIYTGKKEASLYAISSYEFGTTQVKFLADLKVMLNISSTPYIRPLTSSLIYNNEKRKKISSLEDEGTPFIIFTKDLPGFYGNEMN